MSTHPSKPQNNELRAARKRAAEMRARSLERLLVCVDAVISLDCKRPRKRWRARLFEVQWNLFLERDFHRSVGG